MAVCHTSFNTAVNVVPNKVKKLKLKLAAMAVCHTSINTMYHISEILNKEEGKGYESIATLPPFGPIEEHEWFFQLVIVSEEPICINLCRQNPVLPPWI